MELKTDEYGVGKLQLIWEMIKDIKVYDNKVFKDNSEELALKQAEFINKLWGKIP